MNETIKSVHLENVSEQECENIFTLKNAETSRNFHKNFPEYKPTPLAHLKNLASELGVKDIFVKDESYRFGLNAFKGLGGSFCLGKYISETNAKPGEITFVTATDGNHGRGIAWAANKLGQKAVVYMPKGSVEERLENIRKLGAEASITEFNYDDTVRFAAECEKKIRLGSCTGYSMAGL